MKSQITNDKFQIPVTGGLLTDTIIYLEFGAWDLGF